MLTHRNILSNAVAATQIFPIGPKQRLLSFLPLSHMFEQLGGFFIVLLAGASVIYPTSRQPAVVRRTFKERKVSMVLITPAVVKSLMLAIERSAEAQGKKELFEKLRRVARRLPMALRRVVFFSVHRQFGGRFRYIVSGGAALDPALGESWRELGIDVLQGYGTTECSPALTFNRVDLNRLGSVGTPLPGVEVKVAEDGEVLARGPNVFKGYWENEDATRAVLDKDGWYHTGDLGEYDKDGFLWLRGRKKDMIVLADGTNVYPEDIENALAADKRIEALATPLRPAVATVVGLQRPGEDIQVHARLPPEGQGAGRVDRARHQRQALGQPADPRLDDLAGRGVPDDADAEGEEAVRRRAPSEHGPRRASARGHRRSGRRRAS